MSYLENRAIYFCSNDGAALIDIYDPNIDEDEITKYPQDYGELSLETKEALKSRRATLIELLEHVNPEKRHRLNTVVSKQSSIILVCPQCKKVFDSENIILQEKTHSDENTLPYRKPKAHKVISDDKESLDEAINTEFDHTGFANQIFTSDNKEKQEQIRKLAQSNRTKYSQTTNMVMIDSIEHAKGELRQIFNKFGKDNVNVSIYLPD